MNRGARLSGVVVLGIAYWAICIWALQPHIAGPDGIGYVAYLESALFDGDLSLHDEFREHGMWLPFMELTELGHVRNRFAIGSALLWLPFALLADGLLSLGGLLGMSATHAERTQALVCAASFGTAIYGFLTLALCHRVASRFSSGLSAMLAVISVWLLTPLWHYTFFMPTMAHTASAFTVTLTLYRWLRLREAGFADATFAHFALLGGATGLATLVRWQNLVLCALIATPLLLELLRRPGRRAGLVARISLLGLFALIALVPQLAYFRVSFGHALALPQGTTFLHWNHPQLGLALLSSHHGLFGWSPLLLLATAGMLLLVRRARGAGVLCLLLFGVQTYVNSIAGDVWAGASFGARRFVGLTPIFCLGLAVLLDALPRRLGAALVAACAAWSVPLWAAYQFGQLERERHVPYPALADAVWQSARALPELLLAPSAPRFDGLPESAFLRAGLLMLASLCAAASVWVVARRGADGSRKTAGEEAKAKVKAPHDPRLAAVSLLAVLVVCGAASAVVAARSRPAPAPVQRAGDALLLDFGWYANSRFDFDPFLPSAHIFPHHLVALPRWLQRAGVPYRMPTPPGPERRSTVLSSWVVEATRFPVELEPRPSIALHLALVGGVAIEEFDPGVVLHVEYTDGSHSEHPVVPGRDVFSVRAVPPAHRVLHSGHGVMTSLRLELDPQRVPARLVLEAPAVPVPWACLSIFAVTQELWPGGSFQHADLGPVANADHTRDAFALTRVRDHFPDLRAGRLEHLGTPFRILDPAHTPLHGTTLSTAYRARRQRLPLATIPTRTLSLLLDGGLMMGTHGLLAGRLRVVYARGPETVAELRSGRDVRDYWEPGPAGRVAWRGAGAQDLTRYDLSLDPSRVPRFVWLEPGEPNASLTPPFHAGIAVFAITQQTALRVESPATDTPRRAP